jgi:hypothetical protein
MIIVWQGAEETLLAGYSKTLKYKAPEIPRSETYNPVRRNDEGRGQRRRWAFFSNLRENTEYGF